MVKHIKRGIHSACIFIALVIIFTLSGEGLSQVLYRKAGRVKKNVHGGYTSYSKEGRRISTSKPNRRGGYKFYDAKGNKVGTLKRIRKGRSSRSKGTYVFYDANGIKKGILRKRRSGIYYYKDLQDGRIINTIPEAKGEVGSLLPEVFQGKED